MAGAAQMANVSIEELTKAIEKKRAERAAAYEKEKAQYDKDLAVWRRKAAVALRDFAKRIETASGDDSLSALLEDLRYGRWTDRTPTEPRKPDFDQLDRDLRSLKIMVDDSIKLRTDSNFFSYL